jgi:hypothetical protein
VTILVCQHRVSSQGIFPLGGELQQKISHVYIFFLLVMIRNIFRTVQIFMPSNSLVWTAEVYFWVFDALPMLAYTFLFNLFHPGRYHLAMLNDERRAEAASPVPEPFDDVEVGAGGRDEHADQQMDTIKLRPIVRDT